MDSGSFRSRLNTLFNNYYALLKSLINKFFRRFYAHQHQLTSTTSWDRYPQLFDEVVKAYSETKSVEKILSFGCSTGEECFSLKKYFPQAAIIGVDINRKNLRKAIRKNTYNDVNFLHSNFENIRTHGSYDLIFCLSVLCRWEDTKYVSNCEKLYPFGKFESTVDSLASSLNPNGLLVIYNSNFRFEDTATFSKHGFVIVPSPSVHDSGFVYKFDRSNNRIDERHRHCIYRKKAK